MLVLSDVERKHIELANDGTGEFADKIMVFPVGEVSVAVHFGADNRYLHGAYVKAETGLYDIKTLERIEGDPHPIAVECVTGVLENYRNSSPHDPTVELPYMKVGDEFFPRWQYIDAIEAYPEPPNFYVVKSFAFRGKKKVGWESILVTQDGAGIFSIHACVDKEEEVVTM